MLSEAKNKKIGKYIWWGVLAGIFLLAVILNYWTPYIADDYAYWFSWADGKKITSFSQLFPSIYAHAFSMNGRLAPHFLVQFFMLFPKMVFNIVNAGIFTFLFYRLAKNAGVDGAHKLDGFYVLAIFAAYWCVLPAFGQVNLWFDGSFNYLWALALAVAFLAPYFEFFMKGEWRPKRGVLIGYAVLSFFFGNFSENTTAGAIGGAILILLVAKFVYKYQIPKCLMVNIGLAFSTYVLMYMCPAQIANKAGTGGLSAMIGNTYNCIFYMVENAGWLITLWGILFIWGLYTGMSRKKLVLSAVCMLMAMAANFIFIFASYYPERSMCGMLLFVIQANVILLAGLRNTKNEVVLTILCFVMCFNFIYPFAEGVIDVHSLYEQSQYREELIERQIESGEEDIILPEFTCFTKWSPRSGLRDVIFDSTTWPNNYMAKYYGVKSVTKQ